jgi:hypothetical protein
MSLPEQGGSFSLILVYRFGSNRENAEWRWITAGSGVASLLWVLLSIAELVAGQRILSTRSQPSADALSSCSQM